MIWRRRGGELLVMAISSLVAIAIAAVLWPRLRGLRRQRLPAQAVVDQMPGYSPTLVDHAGRALSERPGHVRLVLDPFSGYRNLGNQRATSFTIDENGFRGGFRGGADRALAFLLGASTAFGHGVPRDDDTLASVLSRRQGRYRVVNAGVIGYESGQELGLMTHYLDRFGPRAYIVLDGWNDVFSHLSGPQLDRLLAVNGYIVTVEDRLRMLHEARREPVESAPARPPDEWQQRYAKDPSFRVQQVRDEYVANLLRMGAFARGRGAALLVVFQPEAGCKRRRTPAEQRGLAAYDRFGASDPALVAAYHEIGRVAGEACRAAGIEWLDGNAPVLCESDEELFADAVHLNPRGHERLSELILGRLASLSPPAAAAAATPAASIAP